MSELLVLCYHAVSSSWDDSLAVTPDALERQLTSLLRRGWSGTTFRQAVLDPPAGRALAVTFDDAFASVHELALPILERLGLPGTVFAPTGYVTSGERFRWPGVDHWQATAHAAELAPMSWQKLGELSDRGWEIGSHTQTHPRLTELDDHALDRELAASREEQVRRLGRPADTIAYPYGDVDDRVVEHARVAGYLAGAALARELRFGEVHRWPRVGVYRKDSWWRFRAKETRYRRCYHQAGRAP
jgi:peptidoglycan/xylan/chitin deacetylase (PgdA/CDA1 family)